MQRMFCFLPFTLMWKIIPPTNLYNMLSTSQFLALPPSLSVVYSTFGFTYTSLHVLLYSATFSHAHPVPEVLLFFNRSWSEGCSQ